MREKITLGIAGFCILALIFGSDVRNSQGRKNEEQLYQQLEMFVDAMEIVRKQYVEPVDDKKLIYGALKGMLFSLDPYSAFLEPELHKELQIETQGQFEGVGMEITVKDNLITVVSPIEDTPAWKAGIKSGDKIIEIDGKSTKGFTTMEAARKLRGKRGTEVNVSILREGASKVLKLTLVRDVIQVKSIKPKDLNEFGYVRITEFQERTGEDLEKVLEDFNAGNKKGLILDLRNDPGGLLTAAIEVSEFFLPSGRLIVYTQGRETKDRNVYYSKGKPLWDKPVVILTNGGSASASEIVTGALKDNLPEVKTVGAKTFGKGSVQNLIKLNDGSALKLTIARYYTPKGVCIEGQGIKPDIEVKLPEDEIVMPTEEKDTQFARALEELKKMTTDKQAENK